MLFWSFCAFIWLKNIEKMLLQMTSAFLQLESTIVCLNPKFPRPVKLCWQNKNISKLEILITKVGNIIILHRNMIRKH
jgi:hypothetical protein